MSDFVASGDERLAVLIRSLLLRRTKDQKMESGAALVSKFLT